MQAVVPCQRPHRAARLVFVDQRTAVSNIKPHITWSPLCSGSWSSAPGLFCTSEALGRHFSQASPSVWTGLTLRQQLFLFVHQ